MLIVRYSIADILYDHSWIWILFHQRIKQKLVEYNQTLYNDFSESARNVAFHLVIFQSFREIC